MSYPILYAPNEIDFHHNGFGILSDCISCLVTEVANGSYEVEMKYPMDGIHFDEIKDLSIIKVKSNALSGYQLFRIYGKTKPISGIVYSKIRFAIDDTRARNIQTFMSQFAEYSELSLEIEEVY